MAAMTQGRKPTPTLMRVLTGNPQHRPMNAAEEVPPGELFDAPEWMSDQQREGWRHAIDHAPKGLLRNLDKSLLAAWVIAEDMHRTAATSVARVGLMIRSKHSDVPVQNPYVAIINKQAHIMKGLASELGFSPTSRARIAYGGSTEKERPNKFANNAARRTNGAA